MVGLGKGSITFLCLETIVLRIIISCEYLRLCLVLDLRYADVYIMLPLSPSLSSTFLSTSSPLHTFLPL